MAAHVAAAASRRGNWTAARIFMLISAGYHLPLGIVGFVVDQTFPVGANAAAESPSGHVFGVFETNGWHSLAGLLIALVSLYFAFRPSRAPEAALALGVSQLLVVVGLAVFPPSVFWLASNGADQIIHATTAVGGIGSALLERRRGSRSSAVSA